MEVGNLYFNGTLILGAQLDENQILSSKFYRKRTNRLKELKHEKAKTVALTALINLNWIIWPECHFVWMENPFALSTLDLGW